LLTTALAVLKYLSAETNAWPVRVKLHHRRWLVKRQVYGIYFAAAFQNAISLSERPVLGAKLSLRPLSQTAAFAVGHLKASSPLSTTKPSKDLTMDCHETSRSMALQPK
jgi:hypothetical protein